MKYLGGVSHQITKFLVLNQTFLYYKNETITVYSDILFYKNAIVSSVLKIDYIDETIMIQTEQSELINAA